MHRAYNVSRLNLTALNLKSSTFEKSKYGLNLSNQQAFATAHA